MTDADSSCRLSPCRLFPAPVVQAGSGRTQATRILRAVAAKRCFNGERRVLVSALALASSGGSFFSADRALQEHEQPASSFVFVLSAGAAVCGGAHRLLLRC